MSPMAARACVRMSPTVRPAFILNPAVALMASAKKYGVSVATGHDGARAAASPSPLWGRPPLDPPLTPPINSPRKELLISDAAPPQTAHPSNTTALPRGPDIPYR